MTEDIHGIPADEIDLHVDTDDDGNFIVRVFHRPTSTVKISDYHMLREDAVQQAIEELKELIDQKRNGLV
jgi:hypothetical protein